MQPNYMSMSNYGGGYQPMDAFALTQPATIPDWRSSYLPEQRNFYTGDPAGTGVMPTVATPVGGTASSFGNGALAGNYGDMAPVFTNVASPGGTGNWFRDSGFLSQMDPKTGVQTQGWGGLALGGAQALGGLYLGMKQYNLAKDTLANNKAQFERNFAAQKATTNASLEDRQRARVASNAGAYQSVGDYMNQNGVR